MANLDQEILDTIRAMPGITATETAELVTGSTPKSVGQRICVLFARGQLIRTRGQFVGPSGKPRATWRYSVNDDPDAAPPCQTRRLKQPTPAAISFELEQARARIRELEEWRAEALRRYPDLGVPPIIREARKIVAQLLRENGDLGLADAVMAGQKDAILPMRATITALEAVVD